MRLLLLPLIMSLAFYACGDDSTSIDESPIIPSIDGYTLVWNDEFDGSSLDLTKWAHQNGDGAEFGLNGWGNNELQFYTSRTENLEVSEGMLKMTALEQNFSGRDYTSARIRTADLPNGNWKYGIFEARIKLPVGQGLWPAFWMLPEEAVYGGWPRSGEIDIMEAVMHIPNETHGTVHFGQTWPNNSLKGTGYFLPNGNLNEAFHTFKIIWEEGSIRWFVDDVLFYRVTPANLAPERWPFDQSFHILLNIAVGGNWPGNPDGTTVFPQRMEVDYVRVYQKSN